MFHGSIPSDMRRILAELCLGHQKEPAWIGCSGNFTIERLLWTLGYRELAGNDVTLYSCVIGHFLAGRNPRLELREPDQYEWLTAGLATPAGKVATVMLLSKMGYVISRKSRYHERMFKAFTARWPELVEKLAEKLGKVETRLVDFASADVVDWSMQIPQDTGTVIAFPPFYAGDYTSMFAKIDALFTWDSPTFVEMDEARKDLLLQRVMSCKRWILGLHGRRPELDANLIGMTQTTNRGIPIYIYSNVGRDAVRIVAPKQDLEPFNMPKLGENEEAGDRLSVVRLTGGQFATLRSQYMNANIKPGSPAVAYAVLLDQKVVGAIAFSRGENRAAMESYGIAPVAYMLSDFPIRPTRYPRLSKLVIMAALSHEIRHDLERAFSSRVNGVLTTAFTDRPVSMKYRGVLELRGRKENKPEPGSAHGHQRWMLNYAAKAGAWSLADALSIWKKKHAGAAGKDDS